MGDRRLLLGRDDEGEWRLLLRGDDEIEYLFIVHRTLVLDIRWNHVFADGRNPISISLQNFKKL